MLGGTLRLLFGPPGLALGLLGDPRVLDTPSPREVDDATVALGMSVGPVVATAVATDATGAGEALTGPLAVVMPAEPAAAVTSTAAASRDDRREDIGSGTFYNDRGWVGLDDVASRHVRRVQRGEAPTMRDVSTTITDRPRSALSWTRKADTSARVDKMRYRVIRDDPRTRAYAAGELSVAPHVTISDSIARSRE